MFKKNCVNLLTKVCFICIFVSSYHKLLNLKKEPVVFILWGSFARNKKTFITNKHHLIIESTHPSPFSARNGFFGSKPFSKTNEFLKKNKIKEVNFTLPYHL